MKRRVDDDFFSASERSPLVLYTAADVAGILLVPEKTVNKLVREKKLACVQVTPRMRRFTPEQVQQYIDSHSSTIAVDRKDSRPISSPPRKGGEPRKSTGDSGTDLVKEMRSLCR